MFSLLWKRSTQDALASILIPSPPDKRRAIGQSLQRIVFELSANPLEAGESRDRGRRVHHVAPIGVLFKADPDRMLVRILRVWEY